MRTTPKRVWLFALLFGSMALLALSDVRSVALRNSGDREAAAPISAHKNPQRHSVAERSAPREPNIVRVASLSTSLTRRQPTFAHSLQQARTDAMVRFLQPAKPALAPTSSSDTITYTYDSLNRLTSASYASGGTITYSYDAAGNRTSILVTNNSPLLRIDSVTPQAGRATGGQQIKLSGIFDNLSVVMIGGGVASWNYTNGTSEVTVTTPAHAPGAVSIDLVPTAGSTYSKSNAFAYLPTVFTDDTLVAGITRAKAQHIIELRQAVDALRAVAGLGPAPWADPALSPFSTLIKAVHITELRSFLENAAALLGYPAGSYTDPGLGSGFVIKRVHIEELRQRIRNIAG